MGLIIGPTPWWQANLVSACPEGTTLPDGSRIISKAGGTAYIVAPSCTELGFQQWAGGQYNSTLVGDKCCICEWSGLNTMLIQCGFNPCDWCIPTQSELSSFGYPTCSIWGAAPFCYWSSNELSASTARDFRMGSGLLGSAPKSSPIGYLRAWRRVTY